MSMLTMQADKLVSMAQDLRELSNGQVNQGFPARAMLLEAADAMRGAADTIISLRDRLQAAELGSGTCEFSPTTDNPPTCSNCGWQADSYDCDWLDGGAYEYDGRFCKHCGALVRKAVGR